MVDLPSDDNALAGGWTGQARLPNMLRVLGGKLGQNNPNPAYTLDVTGTANITGALTLAAPVWTGLVYSNSWADYATGYQVGGWWKDASGIVHLRGLLLRAGTSGASETVATLPVGARPLLQESFGLLGAGLGTLIRVEVTTAGVLTWLGGALATPFLTLSGVSYGTL